MNIIVIATDSLRADHLGCYGGAVKTPNIDKFAEEASVFEQAYSENLPTLPCRTAWWTGRYLFSKRGWQPFESSDYLLAEILWNRQYTSALITDTYHMHKPVYNCGRGFDTVVWIRGQEYDPWVVDERINVDLEKFHRLRGDETDSRWKPLFTQYLRNATRFKSEEDHCTARVITECIHWLERITKKQKDRLLLWVDCFDPHEPWDPPSPYREMYDPDYRGHEIIDPVPGPVEGYMTEDELRHTHALYAGNITFVDKWIGLLLDCIKDLGLYDNSLIMFTSDHGEPFGEHGIIRKARPWLYEELVRIPWLIRHPEGLGEGQRFSCFVQPPDLLPTILDALNIQTQPIPPSPYALSYIPGFESREQTEKLQFTGRSLLPVLSGEKKDIRDFVVSGYHGKQWAIRTNQWTYLYNLDGAKPELYDRKNDPQEKNDIWDTNKQIGAELEERLKRFADRLD